jgi:hypothetical protein
LGFYAPGITVTTVKRDGEGVTPLRVHVRVKKNRDEGRGKRDEGRGASKSRDDVTIVTA